MNPIEKYSILLKQLGEVFKESDVIKTQSKGENEWNYALCATPIQQNSGLILGINWGGNEKRYEISLKMPLGDDVKNYSFIKRSRSYLNDYLKVDIEHPNFNYSNFCFFRSPKINNLSKKDIDLCIPILKDYINYISPPWVLSLGVTIVDVVEKQKKEDINISPIKISNNHNTLGYKGNLFGFKYFVLPHPNAHINKIDRDEIWKNVFFGELQVES